MSDLSSRRESKALKALCFDSLEDRSQWPGSEAATEAALVAKGGIIPATCETYGTVAFLAIKVGQEAHKAGWNAGLR